MMHFRSLSFALTLLMVFQVGVPAHAQDSVPLPQEALDIDWANEACILDSLQQKYDQDIQQMDEKTRQHILLAVEADGAGILLAGLLPAFLAGTGIAVMCFVENHPIKGSSKLMWAGLLLIMATGIFVAYTGDNAVEQRKAISVADLKDLVDQRGAEQIDALHEQLMTLSDALDTRDIEIVLTREQHKAIRQQVKFEDVQLSLPGELDFLSIPNLSDGAVILPRGSAPKFRQVLKTTIFDALLRLKLPNIIATNHMRLLTTAADEELLTSPQLRQTNITFPNITIYLPFVDEQAGELGIDSTWASYTMSMGSILNQIAPSNQHTGTFVISNSPYTPPPDTGLDQL